MQTIDVLCSSVATLYSRRICGCLSVAAEESSLLLVLDYSELDRVENQYLTQQKSAVIEYFRGHPLFKLSHQDIQEFAFQTVARHYRSGDIVSRQGSAANFLYFVISGRVELSRRVQICGTGL